MNSKMRSSVMGLILSLFSSPLPEVQKEPVAYLYNGVRLPKLPEWDRGKYPYSYVGTVMYKGIEEYRAYFAKEIHTKYASAMSFLDAALRYRLIDGQWVEHGAGIPPFITSPLWSNVNIYYDSSVEEVGGTLYLSASDPIPVYE